MSTAAAKSLRVRATRPFGFYNSILVPVGKTFTLNKAEDFAAEWMVRVDASTPDDMAAVTVPTKQRTYLADGAMTDAPVEKRTAAKKPSATTDDDSVI